MSAPTLGGRPRGNSAGENKPPPIPGSKLDERLLPPRTEKYLPGTMYALVVCGANDTAIIDEAIFADFMGISCTVKLFSEECKGTFLSCFPIEKYFEENPYSDIKFGIIGQSGTPLFTYSAEKHRNPHHKFFQQVGEADLLGIFTSWVHEMAHKAKPGDVVNIFLQCHGGEQGNIRLGTRDMDSFILAGLLETFVSGVQVNCIGSHCHSGILVDEIKATGAPNRYAISACGPDELAFVTRRSVSNRCRGLRFAQPFVQSLAKCKLPTIHQTEAGALTVEHFHNFMKDALRRVSGNRPPQHIQTYLSTQQQASLILLEELILRDQVDVLNDPRLIHRRRRLEWPLLDLPNLRRIQEVTGQGERSPAAIAQVVRVVDEAVSACYGGEFPEHHPPGDSVIIQQLERKNPDYEMLLNNLYWRGRQQSAIFDLWIILCERGFVKWENMEADIDYSNGAEARSTVTAWLCCFTAVRGEETLREFKPFPGYCLTEFPMCWLSIMIARGFMGKPNEIIETIHHTGILGKFDPNLVPLYLYTRTRRPWNYDPNCSSLRPDMPNWKMDFFGSWLPKGLGPDESTWPEQIVDKFMRRFWAVEKAYKDYYGVPDDLLVEECHQAEYLKAHYELEPRFRHSGQWKPS